MKHNLKVTVLLLFSFILAQFVGLFVMSHYIQISEVDGTRFVEYKEVPFVGPPPEVNQTLSFIPIVIAVLAGTAIIFIIMKLNRPEIFRYWVSLVVFLTLTISFFAVISTLFSNVFSGFPGGPIFLAVLLAGFITFFKLFRPNIFAHNISEIFIYGGIATIFVPLLNLVSVTILLLLISLYDAIAVWKSKHMITLAKFQADSRAFSGLMIPYGAEVAKPKKRKKALLSFGTAKTAILGGGDIAFPLMFAGVVMKNYGLMTAFLIPVFVTIALALLLLKGKEDRFYPAMPVLTAGCFAGFLAILLL